MLQVIIKNLFLQHGQPASEASIIGIPFIIYTNENFNIHAFDNIRLPIARNISDCISFIENDENIYLKDIQESISNNVNLYQYLAK